MLLSEKLSTPESVTRSADDQARANEASKDLALYQFKACPFCIKVRKEIARLGLNIETRDAQHNPEHRSELEAGGGQVKVPCLKIQQEDGSVRWLYESDDIKAWLQERFEPA